MTEAWVKHQGVREVMFFLHGHGVGAANAARIMAELGSRAVPAITANPYILAELIRGIGFLTADRIARSVGFDPLHPARLEAGVMHVLDEATGEGHCALAEDDLHRRAGELLADVDDGVEVGVQALTTAVDRLVLGARVVREAGDVWVERLHDQEVRLGKRLKALADAPPRPPMTAEDRDPEGALSDAERLLDVALSEGQRRAVLATMGARLVVVTGGPGTGKTTVVQTIVQVHRKAGRTVLLAAPTGRAAHRLGEATGRPAATLHRLLEFQPQDAKFQRNAERPLEGDVVIVDDVVSSGTTVSKIRNRNAIWMPKARWHVAVWIKQHACRLRGFESVYAGIEVGDNTRRVPINSLSTLINNVEVAESYARRNFPNHAAFLAALEELR